MAPTIGLNNSSSNSNGGNAPSNPHSADSPLSKTYQYRKIMKPMLERKRRARINRCLDELKELITGALQNNDGEENITKLEKADILELTVRHFHNLKRQNKFYVKPEQTYADRFRDGFSHCAREVTKYLYQANQNRAGEHIVMHLNDCIRRLDNTLNPAGNNNNSSLLINNNYLQSKSNVMDSPPQSFMQPPQQPPTRLSTSFPNENHNASQMFPPPPIPPRDSFLMPRDPRHPFNPKDQDGSVWRPW